MASAAAKLPVCMAQSNGEMDWVPTCTFSTHTALFERGAQVTALRRSGAELMLMAFMTMVEP
eukprot:14991078-Heterocapsa_arctica.AAC.1